MGKKSKAPPPPDPNAVSAAQTRSNKETAAYTAALNRGNTFGPLGSQTFSQRTDPTTGAPIWDQTVSLAPDAQELLNQQLRQSRDVGTVAQSVLPSVASAYGQPLDLSGLPKAYGADDLMGARKEAQDALYGMHTAYLDPQYQERERGLDTMLANKGVVEGSEAYNNARSQFGREREFDYGRARDAAVAGGSQELERLFGMGSADRSRAMGELLLTRDRPMEEFNRLRGSAPVDLPQFSSPSDVGLGATDVMSPIYNAYQGNLDIANANQASKNSTTNAVLSTAAIAAMVF